MKKNEREIGGAFRSVREREDEEEAQKTICPECLMGPTHGKVFNAVSVALTLSFSLLRLSHAAVFLSFGQPL